MKILNELKRDKRHLTAEELRLEYKELGKWNEKTGQSRNILKLMIMSIIVVILIAILLKLNTNISIVILTVIPFIYAVIVIVMYIVLKMMVSKEEQICIQLYINKKLEQGNKIAREIVSDTEKRALWGQAYKGNREYIQLSKVYIVKEGEFLYFYHIIQNTNQFQIGKICIKDQVISSYLETISILYKNIDSYNS